MDVALACTFDFVKQLALFSTGQRFKVFDFNVLSNVFPENGDVDVFRKSGDQAIGLGQ